MSIREKISKLCQNNNITVQKLEKDLNFGGGTISKWNTSSPKLDNLVKVCDYFHVSIDWLLDRDINKNYNYVVSEHEQNIINMYRTLSTEVKKVIDVNIEMQYKIAIKSKLSEEKAI